MRSTDKLDPDQIKANLHSKLLAKEVVVYSSTSSTNDLAWQYAQDSKNNGIVIFAEYQTAGRGRAANNWLSPKEDSILCSIVLIEPGCQPEILSLIAAVGLAQAIGPKAKIKWPNDIILNNKKIAGILLESKTLNKRKTYVLGIGVNCHQKHLSFPGPLCDTATSIDIETKAFCDRISLAKRLLVSIDQWLIAGQKNADAVIQRWQQLSTQLGRRIELIHNKERFAGNCIGIDPDKGLIIQLDTGFVRIFDSAHTTIVKS